MRCKYSKKVNEMVNELNGDKQKSETMVICVLFRHFLVHFLWEGADPFDIDPSAVDDTIY